MGKKENSIWSPMLAVISLGTNLSAPLPTVTGMVTACARVAEATAARAVEKCIARLET